MKAKTFVSASLTSAFCAVSFLLSVSLLAPFNLTAMPAAAVPAASTAKVSVSELVQVFINWSGNPSDKGKLSDAAKYIDYESMAQRALGQPQWAKLTVTQRNQFVEALRTAIEQRYYPRWHRLFAKGSIVYGAETQAKGDTSLSTVLTVNKKKQNLSWLLASKGGTPRVVSLSVDNKDLLSRLHARIAPRLEKRGFDNVLAWLKDKSSSMDEDNAGANKSN